MSSYNFRCSCSFLFQFGLFPFPGFIFCLAFFCCKKGQNIIVDKDITLIVGSYFDDDDFHSFYNAYLRNQEQHGSNHGILAQEDLLPPPNAYTVSCIPWVSFQHFSVHSYENKPYFFPSVEAGKFTEENGKLMMPLSITCHHAATDGYHVTLFLQKLQEEADRFAVYIQ